ncbi:MAG: valine--tRNA ligase [Bdellovibrionaceae bacterium]|nr:valine--tRNA ligase [Pseudobdellovibrionaceae bacterium]
MAGSSETQEMLDKQYQPAEVESKIYQMWLDKACFKAEDTSTKPPFSIILPPPNVTGFLHLGHALDHTLQDVLIRWKRMSGFNATWVPGTDHAGISTQSVVEKKLAEENLSRLELGRDKFVEQVWQWKEQYGSRIVSQMQRLGNSCDWDRLTFTLDEGVSKAVRKVFVELYNKGLIYRGKKLVNWSPKLQTAISDIEVDYKEVKGKLYHIAYPLEDGSQELIIATTRPETMLGDAAVCVHPADERYQGLIGKNIVLPLVGRKIPIIADDYVDKDFGSGALKITPAHDFNDYEIGKKHSLPMINILNVDGTLVEGYGEFSGLKVQEARKKVVEALEAQNLIRDIVNHTHSVGHCEKTGAVAEPFLSEQWFVKMTTLAGPAIRAAETGTTSFIPESWVKTYLHWLRNIQDWCISRQLWWGHRIPVWHCKDCAAVTVSEEDVQACSKCASKNVEQDQDVLDTWFSSALWPFSTLGWPEQSEALKTFYPTNVLITGHDIIFFWVARMMMMGLEFCKDVPFRHVFIHGLIRDAKGVKMSKSLGNSVDPVEMIDQYGADALRFTLMTQAGAGKDLKFSIQRLEGNRNFMNKIWNATRFALSAAEVKEWTAKDYATETPKSLLSVFDQWIIFKMIKLEEQVHKALEQYRFSDAANALYSFVWNDFCDWYLEFSKPVLYGKQQDEKAASSLVLFQVLARTLKMLHPFVPFITEEIYGKLPLKDAEILCTSKFPHYKEDKDWGAQGKQDAWEEVEIIKEVITALRNIRGENSIPFGVEMFAHIVPKDDRTQKVLSSHRAVILKMCKLSDISFEPRPSLAKCALTPLSVFSSEIDIVIPLEGLVDLEEEIKRLEKNMEKTQKDIQILSKKLNNENFIKNAPPELVEQDTALLKEAESKFKALQDSLNRLKLEA